MYKQVQPTEWSRKSGVAGRGVTDIRDYELSHRGLGDFFVPLVVRWPPSEYSLGSEWLRVSSPHCSPKKAEEVDEAAKVCHKEASPDKHKEAMKLMEPLAQELMNCIAAKVPVQNSDASEELAKAKAKLAQHGIEMSPLKRKSESEPSSSDQQGKRAKPPMPVVDVESKPLTDVEKLLAEPKRMLDSRPKGATDDHVTDWLNTFKTKPEF